MRDRGGTSFALLRLASGLARRLEFLPAFCTDPTCRFSNSATWSNVHDVSKRFFRQNFNPKSHCECNMHNMYGLTPTTTRNEIE